MNDDETAQQIASATGMPAGEVEATLSETAQRVEANRDNPTQAAAEAKQGMAQLLEKAKSSGALEQKAEEVKPAATRAAWITFGALVLSLLAALIGAMVGRRKPATVGRPGHGAPEMRKSYAGTEPLSVRPAPSRYSGRERRMTSSTTYHGAERRGA